MPIYEYRCADCGSTFELFLRSTDRAVNCPCCGCDRVTKLFSAFAHHSTGSPGAGTKSGCGSCSGKSCSSCR